MHVDASLRSPRGIALRHVGYSSRHTGARRDSRESRSSVGFRRAGASPPSSRAETMPSLWAITCYFNPIGYRRRAMIGAARHRLPDRRRLSANDAHVGSPLSRGGRASLSSRSRRSGLHRRTARSFLARRSLETPISPTTRRVSPLRVPRCRCGQRGRDAGRSLRIVSLVARDRIDGRAHLRRLRSRTPASFRPPVHDGHLPGIERSAGLPGATITKCRSTRDSCPLATHSRAPMCRFSTSFAGGCQPTKSVKSP